MKSRFTLRQPIYLKSIEVKSDPALWTSWYPQFARQRRSTGMRNGRRKIRRYDESTLGETVGNVWGHITEHDLWMHQLPPRQTAYKIMESTSQNKSRAVAGIGAQSHLEVIQGHTFWHKLIARVWLYTGSQYPIESIVTFTLSSAVCEIFPVYMHRLESHFFHTPLLFQQKFWDDPFRVHPWCWGLQRAMNLGG